MSAVSRFDPRIESLRGVAAIAVVIAAFLPRAAGSQTSDAVPSHVDAYLCETQQEAIAFADRLAQGDDEETAKDAVGKAAGGEVCGRYVGEAIVQEQKRATSAGVGYSLTAFRFAGDNRVAWGADVSAAKEQSAPSVIEHH